MNLANLFTNKSRVIISFSFAVLLLLGCDDTPEGPVFEITLIASGLSSPTSMAAPPDGSGRLFITEQTGAVKTIDPTGTVGTEPFIDVSERMSKPFSGYDESGLLGIAFHPQFKNNRRFFLFYTAPLTPESPQGYHSHIRVSEFFADKDNPDIADKESEQVLLEFPNPQSTHNGGQLAFGPDGYLYIGVGDGGGANDVGLGHTPDLGNAQDTTNLFGTILRIDVSQSGTYEIPTDNPFAGDPLKKNEIYAYGLRNPWRFSFDNNTGRLFCGDVGQNLYEEINIITAGGNFGWNIREALSCFNKDRALSPLDSCAQSGADDEPLIDPVISYGRPGTDSHLQGRSVTGGYVYRGKTITQLEGIYVFGDWSTSFTTANGSLFIGMENQDGTWRTEEAFVNTGGAGNRRLGLYLLSFGEDENGELYLLTSKSLGPSLESGEIYKITAFSSD